MITTNVKSLSYPEDEIIWTHNLSDREYDYADNPSGTGKGHILFRKSPSGNSRDYDFRNVVFRRWRDAQGSYIIYKKSLTATPLVYIDFKAFEEGYTSNHDNYIGSHDVITDNNVNYYLDNFVIGTSSVCYHNNIKSSHGVNVLGQFIHNTFDKVINSYFTYSKDNNIKNITTCTFSGMLYNNYISNISNSIIGTATSNKISYIDTNNIINLTQNSGSYLINAIATHLEYNTFNKISRCLSITISNNIVNEIYGNTVSCISYNTSNYINNNSGSALSYNNVLEIDLNTNFSNIIHNSGNIISSNLLSTTYSVIRYNSVLDISNNQYCEIILNTGTRIVNNTSINQIYGNNTSKISANYNMDLIKETSGYRVTGLTGGTGSTLLQIEEIKNVDLNYVLLNNNLKRHTFLSTIELTTLNPTTNMRFATYSTVSRYLFNLVGHYEEIANSTGLTWSGPIA